MWYAALTPGHVHCWVIKTSSDEAVLEHVAELPGGGPVYPHPALLVQPTRDQHPLLIILAFFVTPRWDDQSMVKVVQTTL